MEKVIKDLKYNIKLCKAYLKERHTIEIILETKGLIGGYEFAISLLKKEMGK